METELDHVLQMVQDWYRDKGGENGVRTRENIENGRENSRSPPYVSNNVASNNRPKQAEVYPAPKIRDRLLQRALESMALERKTSAMYEAKLQAAERKIAQLEEELRQARAKQTPPHLNLRLSTGKRPRYASSSSSDSDSGSRSRSTNRGFRSRRSESPPQLSPAITPQPLDFEAFQSHDDSRNDRYKAQSFSSSASKHQNQQSKCRSWSRDRKRNDTDRNSREASSEQPSSHTKMLRSGVRTSTTSTNSASAVGDTRIESLIRGDSELISSRSRSKSGGLLTLVEGPHVSMKKQDCVSTGKNGIRIEARDEAPKKILRSSSSNHSPLKTPAQTPLHETEKPRSKGLKNKRDTEKSEEDEVPPRKILRSRAALVPPKLEKNVDTGSEEELDPFTCARHDTDESEELVDIDEGMPLPRTAMPANGELPKSSFPEGRLSRSQAKLDESTKSNCSHLQKGGGSDDKSERKEVSFRKAVGGDKLLRSRSTSSAREFSSRADRSPPYKPGAKDEETFARKLTRIKLEPEEHSERGVLVTGPFPDRTFDNKIDYTLYQSGDIISDVGLNSPNYYDTPEMKPFARVTPAIDDYKIRSSGVNSLEQISGKQHKKSKKHIDRFISTVSKDDNFMVTSEPYHFYLSDTNMEKAAAELENDDNFKKIQQMSVEIPRWRERIFPSYDPTEALSENEENLDDQTFLKRHSKNEINERRRKRWDSQRMREESYLERLKKRGEERENMRREKRKRKGRAQRSDGYEGDIEMESFQPLFKDAIFIRNTEQLPISVFGYPLPAIEPSEFQLPWSMDKTSRTQLRKSEPGKQQTVGKQSSKLSLRSQPKR